MLTQGTTPASLFHPCVFTAMPTVKVAANASPCEVFGPTDCAAATNTLNVQAIIDEAQANYRAQELGNCSDLTYHISDPGPVALSNGDSCADVLNITLHMVWWWSVNGDNCTANDVGFANCFYDLVPKYNAANCSDLSGNAYCPKPDISHFSGANSTLDFYTAWNIYNFQQWSYMYYQSMFDGFSIVSSQIWNTTVAFEHLHATDLKVEIMLAVLTFALGLISPSGWASEIPGDFASAKQSTSFLFRNQVPGEYLLRAAQQSPGFAHNLEPTGNLDDATVASDQIDAQLGQYVTGLAAVIQSVAVDVPNNLTAFAQWLSTGYYFNEPPAMNDMVESIRQALNTYVLSQVLQDNNVIITRQVDTDPYALQTNATGKQLEIDLGCKDGYNNLSMCGTFWYDKTNNIAYSLYNMGDYWADYTNDLETVFDIGLTTPDLLFLGSQWCALGANATQGAGPEQALNSGTAVSTACLSNLPVCTWNLQDQWPEFYESACPQDSNYDMPDCAADGVDVPLGYLGYDLFNGATCESEEKKKLKRIVM